MNLLGRCSNRNLANTSNLLGRCSNRNLANTSKAFLKA